VPYIQALRNRSWELFIVPNNIEKNEWSNDERISLIDSGKVGPADKRDLAANKASGDILVFLDDDSYPEPNILEIANKQFADTNVIAVGGPGVTPPSDSFWQKVSGAVFMSRFTGGAPERYLPLGKTREIDDWPSVNLMVKKEAFLSVGGFDSKYWPGEDTMLCLKLKKTGKIIYEPNMIVWHHRRAGLRKHLKQIGAYGLHRGFFAKKYPYNSFKFKYFLPSAFVIFSIISLFYLLLPHFLQNIIILGWLAYFISLVLGTFEILRYEKILVALSSLLFILPTHFYYGLNFMYGYLFKKNIISRLN